MATEGVNPTAAAVEHHTVTFETRAYDDNVATYCILTYGLPLPDYAYVRFEDFGNGTTNPNDREGVFVALIGGWANLSLADPYDWIVIHFQKSGDAAWTVLLVEPVASAMLWSSTTWRRFDVSAIVGINPISDYKLRIGFYRGDAGSPTPDSGPPYTLL